MYRSSLREHVVSDGNIPTHIAIIMDGNGRWAKNKNLPRFAGHKEGINSVREITRICGELYVQHLTLYTFSSENWSRPDDEVSALMKLLLTTIRREIKELNKSNVRLTTIGSIDDLPHDARKGILEGIAKTKANTGLNLNLALSYGSRQEILNAINKICVDLKNNRLSSAMITEDIFNTYLYTANMPDPELLIRTGGEERISNFMLWQIAYTELYVTDVYWPAFRAKNLLLAIQNYQERERRFGQLSKQF